MLKPIQLMYDRYFQEKEDSDVSAFYGLMFFGEFLTKLIVCAYVSGILEDRDRIRYGLLRQLVRADGVGEWATQLDLALTGSSAQFLRSDYYDFQRELTRRATAGDWEFEAVRHLHAAIQSLQIDLPPMPQQSPLRQWFSWFAILRNKTRGHGAPLTIECSRALAHLAERARQLVRRYFLSRTQSVQLRV